MVEPQTTETGNALQALIREHMANTGDTLADIAARGGLPRQTLSGLLYREDAGAMPRRKTLDRLAVGLGLSRSAVADAAGRAATLNGEDGPLEHRLTVVIEIAKTLPPSQVDVLIATARALARSATNGHDTP